MLAVVGTQHAAGAPQKLGQAGSLFCFKITKKEKNQRQLILYIYKHWVVWEHRNRGGGFFYIFLL